ncbi:MAG: type VI secretion system tip protein TssI/VgrG [Polyangiaceae bacterium]
MADAFRFLCTSLPESAVVLGFSGEEALSELYAFDVFVATNDGAGRELDLADFIGARASLVLSPGTPDDPAFLFAGVVSRAALVNQVGARTVFRLTLSPELHRLALGVHSRVFTDQSVPDIVRAVLGDNGIDAFELRLTREYAVEAHVCQYKESDLAFLSRWLEREGMYWFFEHGEAGEKLVITDHRAAHAPAKRGLTARYAPAAEDETKREALHAVALHQRALPASVRVADYDYARPALALEATAQVSSAGLAEWSVHGDRAFSPADAQRLATIRAESLRATEQTLAASGTQRWLSAGRTFDLAAHPLGALNQTWLVTRARHRGRAGLGSPELDAARPSGGGSFDDLGRDPYRVEIEALAASTPFRAARATPWPRVHAFENAIVDGPSASQYAQIDDQGRYAVKMKFDEGTLKNGKASTWVRMAQPHGGAVEGFHFPLRKGTEVMIAFLGGDPDRPVIASVLPNASTPSPVTASNNTKNVLRTGGNSQIEIEDMAGAQYIKQSTPTANTGLYMGHDGTSPGGHHVELATDGSGLESYGQHFDRFVGAAKNEHVVGPVARSYDATYATSVAGDVTETYGANHTTTITGNTARTVLGTATEVVTGAVTRTFASTYTESVGASVAQTYQASHQLNVAGTQKIGVDGVASHTYGAGLSQFVDGTSSHVATASYELTADPNASLTAAASLSLRGDATATLSAPATTVKGDAVVAVGAGSTITISSTAITVNGTTVITLDGPSLIEILGGDVTISGGNVGVAATANLIQVADGALELSGQGTSVLGGPAVELNAGIIKLNS